MSVESGYPSLTGETDCMYTTRNPGIVEGTNESRLNSCGQTQRTLYEESVGNLDCNRRLLEVGFENGLTPEMIDRQKFMEEVESTHGKRIDPQRLKQNTLSNLEKRTTEAEENARQFLDQATIEVDRCYICNSSEREFVRDMYGYAYVRCQNCTHVYLTRRLPQDAVYEFFETSSEFASTYTDERQIQYRLENIGSSRFCYRPLASTLGFSG